MGVNGALAMFLSASKAILQCLPEDATIHVVIGNESSDLDSVIAAIVYAYLLSEEKKNLPNEIVIPVINVLRDEFSYRTESIYALQKFNITAENLIFKNDLNLSDENRLKLHLVDHHVLSNEQTSLQPSVIEIIDHRPQNEDVLRQYTNLESVKIELVGSCCTLIAEELLTRRSDLMSKPIAELLVGPILLDTSNFSPVTKRATDKDVEIYQKLVDGYVPEIGDGQKLFAELMMAKTNVSSLTSLQILNKDVKFAGVVALPTLPMLLQDFIKREDSKQAFNEFINQHKSQLLVIIGLKIVNTTNYRDLGVYEPISQNGDNPSKLNRVITNGLLNDGKCLDGQKLSKEVTSLQLEELECHVDGLRLFKQNNLSLTRKYIMPIVVGLLDDYDESVN